MTPEADGSPNGFTTTKIRCPQCGSLNYPSDPFCPSCGKEREPATVTHLPAGPMQLPGQSQRERSRPPNATLILLLGCLSLLLGHYWILGLLLGPVAWVLGNRALAALAVGEASPAERRQIQLGRICGMISTGFLALLLARVRTARLQRAG